MKSEEDRRQETGDRRQETQYLILSLSPFPFPLSPLTFSFSLPSVKRVQHAIIALIQLLVLSYIRHHRH